MNRNQLKTRAMHDHNRASHLAHDNDRMREALALIADIAEGSTTANSLPNIARVARNALVGAAPANPALQPQGA
jgi:hypothetical protein